MYLGEWMYSVISHDGQVYGPVDIETLKGWIAEGRVTPQTNLIDVLDGRTIRATEVPGLALLLPLKPPPVAQHSAHPMATSASVVLGPEGQRAVQINNYVHAGYTPSALIPGTKTRLAYILLGLFLGGLGVHNFYAGYTSKGVIQLLVCLFTGWLVVPLIFIWIWVLVEIVTVTHDAEGRALA